MSSVKKAVEFFVPVKSRPILERLSKSFVVCGKEVKYLYLVI